MSTKYILHGGEARIINAENDNFFNEILRDYPISANVLLVEFASEPEKVEKHRVEDLAQFERAKSNRIIIYKVANEGDFATQIAWADIIYFSGGRTPILLNTLNHFSGLQKLFEGKTVVGESAGANCLSTYCYSKSGGILKCLGCVPVKFIPHFHSDLANKFANFHEELEELFLPIYHYKVFNKNS